MVYFPNSEQAGVIFGALAISGLATGITGFGGAIIIQAMWHLGERVLKVDLGDGDATRSNKRALATALIGSLVNYIGLLPSVLKGKRYNLPVVWFIFPGLNSIVWAGTMAAVTLKQEYLVKTLGFLLILIAVWQFIAGNILTKKADDAAVRSKTLQRLGVPADEREEGVELAPLGSPVVDAADAAAATAAAAGIAGEPAVTCDDTNTPTPTPTPTAAASAAAAAAEDGDTTLAPSLSAAGVADTLAPAKGDGISGLTLETVVENPEQGPTESGAVTGTAGMSEGEYAMLASPFSPAFPPSASTSASASGATVMASPSVSSDAALLSSNLPSSPAPTTPAPAPAVDPNPAGKEAGAEESGFSLCRYFTSAVTYVSTYPAKSAVGIFTGCVAGFLGGAFGISGPPISMYMSFQNVDGGTMRDTCALIFAMNLPFLLASRIVYGILTVDEWAVYLLGLPVAIGSLVIGNWLHYRIPGKIVMMILQALILLSSILMTKPGEDGAIGWAAVGLYAAVIVFVVIVVRWRCQRNDKIVQQVTAEEESRQEQQADALGMV